MQPINGFRLEHVIASKQIEGATDAPLHITAEVISRSIDTGKADIRNSFNCVDNRNANRESIKTCM